MCIVPNTEVGQTAVDVAKEQFSLGTVEQSLLASELGEHLVSVANTGNLVGVLKLLTGSTTPPNAILLATVNPHSQEAGVHSPNPSKLRVLVTATLPSGARTTHRTTHTITVDTITAATREVTCVD